MDRDREDIEFDAEGVTLRGWFYPAAGGGRRAPCVVLAHGWASTKEMYLDDYAAVFAAAGLASVVFDFRGFGASDAAAGKPRHEIDPWEQIRDYQHAITYAGNRPDVDADRIGLWGTSYSAGHAFAVAAMDRRVKAVVGQTPLISGRRTFEAFVRADIINPALELLATDRAARARGETPGMIPVVTKDPASMAALPTAESYAYFTIARRDRNPAWLNEVTLRSMEHMYGYEPGPYLPKISPTPLLMLVAPYDRLTPGEWALAAYETAAQPKKLVMLPGGHFSAYTGESFKLASTAARDWFAEHLLTR
ncbi:alpha/beta hydrolase [Streptosporangium subroseum]|uniref:alpha/beta hydrolase n=1 Tax=Streptosporangium subroseum TaxID=106412 RepID=UPI0030883145|nr:alpha/beta hydrolase [Streptosporangium subroseum]